jgi:hypothetical protein
MSVDEWHDVEEDSIHVARVEERKNVRMLEISGKLDLAEKSFCAECGATFAMKDFERNAAVMFDVLGGVDSRHPASADNALDSVSLGEQSAFGERLVGHALR